MPPAAAAAMAGLRPGPQMAWKQLVCAQCRRSLTTSPAVSSGHNRWSKIRHEKGAADLKKTALRSNFTKAITMYSQMYGADVTMNAQLAATVANAKKAGVPKAVIESAIARGQGRSADGASLENATFEIMMPPSIALIVDVETESKARVLQDLNALIRRKGGTVKSTKFFFARRGRVVLGAPEGPVETSADGDASETAQEPTVPSADDILEDAIEAGAEDVETDEDGNIIVWTPPNKASVVVNSVTAGPFKDRLAVLSADTIWAVNEETRVPLGTQAGELQKLLELVAALRAYPDVRAVYSNAVQGEAPDDSWRQLEQDLDW